MYNRNPVFGLNVLSKYGPHNDEILLLSYFISGSRLMRDHCCQLNEFHNRWRESDGIEVHLDVMFYNFLQKLITWWMRTSEVKTILASYSSGF
jgi:hypothetical protein